MLQNSLLVKYDVNNITHRKAYYHFQNKFKWHPKAPRFIVEPPFLDVPTMIQSKLLSYYLKQEFTNRKKETL
jgi:hypothetical protein